MNELIQADGVTIGKSDRFALPPLNGKSRALTVDAQNGVLECIRESAKLSESLGGGGMSICTILVVAYIPRTAQLRR